MVQPWSTITVLARYFIQNLSAWKLATEPKSHRMCKILVTTNSTASIPNALSDIRETSTTTPVIPVTAGGTVYYHSLLSLAAAPALISALCQFFSTTATPIARPPIITAPQPETSSFIVQEIEKLLPSSKKGHFSEQELPSTLEIHFSSTSGSARLESPLTDDR